MKHPAPGDIQQLHTLCGQGRYSQAADLAQVMTERFPHHDLGWMVLIDSLQRMGRPLDALAAMQKAAALRSDPQLHCSVGFALLRFGRLTDAEASFRRALQLKPDYAEVHNNLGNVLQALGQLVEAESSFRRAQQLKSDYVEAHNNLGNVLQARGQLVEAEASYRRAVELKPDLAEPYNNLGNVLQARGQLVEAEASYRRAVRLKPDYLAAHNNLGNVLQTLGRLAEAEASYRKVLHLKPDYLAAHNNLGNVLRARGRLVEAEASFRRALHFQSDYVAAHNNLGSVLLEQGQLVEAEASFRRALQLKSDYAEAHDNLGNTLVALGRFVEAETSYQRALQIRPDYASAYSNLLLSHIYRTDKTVEAVFDAHREYQALFGAPHHRQRPDPESRPRSLTGDRRLKVGYLSPDFRRHSVAFFISPLLREHDRQAVEVFCYADVAAPDMVTSALQGRAEHWQNTAALTDAELVERIGADAIDILVDLAGHTARNRLPVFACQAAPIQVTWLGYPNTTGLQTMSYRLVDAVTDPPGEADRWASEVLIRLESGYLCFEPATDSPLPGGLPCLAGGTLTFASFNNPAKLSAATLDAWSRLLDRVPGSRLLLKGQGFAEEATRQGVLKRFTECGGDTQRVVLLGRVDSLADHLAVYEQVDIALDPFPYNGTTTTCEALWMGVPTVTLLGDRHAGRVGASLLTQVGLTDLIAPSPETYIDIAAALAADRGRLSSLRQTMRDRMRTSSLCDRKSFARKIEAAYRAMWQQHCIQETRDPA